MSKEKLTVQLKKAYRQLEEESKNKGRPNTIEDNNVDYDNCNIYAMRQKIKDLETKLAEKEKEIEIHKSAIRKMNRNCDTVKCQNKISFCIEQLEKVKEFVIRQLMITTKGCNDLDEAEAKGCNELRAETIKEIDNQIKQLKEKK